jgi:hypothetical protein
MSRVTDWGGGGVGVFCPVKKKIKIKT